MYYVISRVSDSLCMFQSAFNFYFNSSVATHRVATFIFSSLLLITIIAVILYIRNKLFTVVCWFCGCSLNVSYKEKNSFTCIHCDQYNGFGSDGGYNKTLDAQHKSNSFTRYASPGEFHIHSDILCSSCNENQLIINRKIAEFEPLNESHWQKEYKQYKEKLEVEYALCANCLQKSKSWISHINRNVFPSLIDWLTSKGRKSDKPRKSRKSHRNENPVLQKNLSYTCLLPNWLHLLARCSSLSCFLFLLVGTVIGILIMRFCSVSTKIDGRWSAKLIELVYPLSLNITSQSCPYLIRLRPYFTLSIYGWLWFSILLFILQGVLTGLDRVMHNRTSNLDSLFDRFVANPFIFLCDLSLLVLSGNILMDTIMNVMDGSAKTSLLSSGRYAYLVFMLLAAMLLVLASYYGLKTWLSFCSYDLHRQKETLREHWPDISLETEAYPASQFTNCISGSPSYGVSPFTKTRQSDPSTLPDIPREFSSLAISPPQLSHKRSSASTTAISFRPSFLSANSISGSKTVFDSKKSDYSLFSCPTVMHKPAPSDTPYRGHFAHSDSDECDDNSLVTSVSRTKRHSMPRSTSSRSFRSAMSQVSAWQSDCGRCSSSRRRRKTNRRRKSLLRFCLTFLFGQLDSWKDVVSELTYLFNALLLGSIIYGMCRLLLCLLQL